MKWDDLRVFLEVARTGQGSGAGRVLGLDAATVGRRISALEATLGTPLFTRSPRGYALTEAGQRLLDPAKAMELAAGQAARTLGPEAGRVAGSVRIGAPEGVASYVLPDACADLADQNPALRVELVALPRVFSLSQREADIAIGVSAPDAGRLRVQRVADYGLHLYATPDFLAAHLIARSEDLRNVRFLGYITDMIFDKELDYVPLISRDLRPQMTSTSLTVQLNWTAQGAGICVLPDFVARARPELVRVLPEDVAFTRSFFLIRHDDGVGVPRIDRTVDALVEALRHHLRDRSAT
ncbi:MAG: LysR family transcriptional regulator [Pseudomonadota bacterium]